MLRSVAMKYWNVVWLVLKTAAPISVGNVLLTVEWELLAIFAATLGGNQVAAWGIGTLRFIFQCLYVTSVSYVVFDLYLLTLKHTSPRRHTLTTYSIFY